MQNWTLKLKIHCLNNHINAQHKQIESVQDRQGFTLETPILWGKTNKCLSSYCKICLQKHYNNPPFMDQNSLEIPLAIAYGFLRQNHTEDAPKPLYKLDRQTLDPPWIQ